MEYARPAEYVDKARSELTVSTGRTLAVVFAALAFLTVLLTVNPDTLALNVIYVGLGVPAAWLVWRRPELGLLALVFVACSFIPLNTINLRLIVGGLNLRD